MFGAKDTPALRKELAAVPVSPQILVGSATVDGNPPVWPGSIVVTNAKEARKVVDEIKAGGADFVKIYGGLSRNSYFALADEARKQNIPFVGHLPFEVTAQEASDAGQRSIEHLDGIAFGCSSQEKEYTLQREAAPNYVARMHVEGMAYNTFDGRQCMTLFVKFRQNQTWQVPTLTVNRAMGLLDDRRLTRDARLVYMSSRTREHWSDDPRFRRWTPQMFDLKRALFAADEKLVGAMYRAGVPIMAGTDAMNPFCFPGFSLHDELALLVEAGLTPLAALQSATLRPAEFMNRSDEIGTIAAGKRADLVLLDADPLADIHNTTRIRGVFLAGKYFDSAAIQHILDEAKHRRKN